MQDHVYRLTEIVGTSHVNSDDAIRLALARAQKTLRNVRWFEVTSTRGSIDLDGTVQYQVKLQIGFTLEE